MKYDNPSIAVDVVLISLIKNELHVLIRKRGEEFEKGKWALPGAMIQKFEKLEEKALSVLKEKLHINSKVYIEQLYTFDDPVRDNRQDSRIISVSYLGLVDSSAIKAEATDKSTEIQWVSIDKIPQLAFDHNKIIDKAIERLQNKVRYTSIGFSLVPKEFTIPELRLCFEKILKKPINPTNFRIKLLKLNLLKKSNKKAIKGKGQPAPVYTVDLDAVNKLENTETLFNK